MPPARPQRHAARLRPIAAAVLAGLALQAPPPARAAHIPFRDEPVSYELQDESLKSFLQRFFDDIGMAVVMSPLVQGSPGTLNGPREGSAADVFKSIADSNGLVAYYDGSVVYVYKSRELGSRYVQVDPSRVETLRRSAIGLADGSDTLQVRGDSGLVALSGTPRFLEQMTQLGTALAHAEPRTPVPQRDTRTVLHFIPLKYAWAADTSFRVGDQQTVVPGVATILKQLLGQAEGPAEATGRATASAGGLRGRGLAALGDRLAAASAQRDAMALGGGDYTSSAAPLPPPTPQSGYGALLDGGDAPRIVADSYRNALIIRDMPERMAMYDQLVQQLDVESQIIQLDATIIDIDKTKAQQYGVNWGYINGNTSVLFGGGLYPLDSAGNLAGLQIGAVIGNTAKFMSRVNALEQDGVTSVVQRPQVVTLNDVEAVIESTQSVYVPVAGAFDEDLYGIVAGTVLRVTPHMILDNGRQRIRLLVTIEDGNVQVTSQSVSSTTGQTINQAVPLVSRNAVNTQAVIDVGQGLLLGGLNRHEDDHTVTKVPLLGDIPLLGHLFRSDTVKRDQTERLFLIAPHIVLASAAAGGAVPEVPPPGAEVPQLTPPAVPPPPAAAPAAPPQASLAPPAPPPQAAPPPVVPPPAAPPPAAPPPATTLEMSAAPASAPPPIAAAPSAPEASPVAEAAPQPNEIASPPPLAVTEDSAAQAAGRYSLQLAAAALFGAPHIVTLAPPAPPPPVPAEALAQAAPRPVALTTEPAPLLVASQTYAPRPRLFGNNGGHAVLGSLSASTVVR